MKKLVVLMMAVAFALTGVNAQMPVSPLNEGLKLLRYEKNKSALAFFKDAYEKMQKTQKPYFGMVKQFYLKMVLVFLQKRLYKLQKTCIKKPQLN